MSNPMQEIVKKVTMKALGLDKETLIPALAGKKFGEHIAAAIVVALVGGAPKVVTGDKGESLCFQGDILAVNQLTGVAIRGASMYLPSVAETALAGELRRAGTDGIVKCKFSIIAKKDEKSAVGYVWGLLVHGQEEEQDPLKQMLLDMPLTQTAKAKLALEAPKVADKTETKKGK